MEKYRVKIIAASVLMALGVAGQILPFMFQPEPAPGKPPPVLRAWWTADDIARAEAFTAPVEPARLAAMLTALCWLAIVFFLARGIAEKQVDSGKTTLPKPGFVALLLVLLGLTLFLLDKPFLWMLYLHSLAFGMTVMGTDTLVAIWALRGVMAVILFAGNGMIIYCLVNMFPRRWWIAAPLILFLLFSIIPELIPYAARDPVEQLTPLEEGPHRTAIETVLDRAGVDIPIMVSDSGSRDQSVNAWLGGRAAARYVVLTDTFIMKFSAAEAAMAIAHELGHYHNELFFMALRKTSELARLFVVFGAAWFFHTRRVRTVSPLVILALILLVNRLTAMAWIAPSGMISRLDERLADAYALKICDDPAAFAGFLAKGALYNLEPPETRGVLRKILSDHPDIMERLKGLTKQLEHIK